MQLPQYPRYESYKDSGLEWLGEIPSGWNVMRLRDIFNFSKGLTITKENLRDTGVPCVSYGEVHSKYPFEVDPERHNLKCVDESYLSESPKSLLRRGDFVFADTSEDLEGAGNFTVLDSDTETFAGYHTIIARPFVGVSPRFLAYVLASETARNQTRRKVKGVKVFSVTNALLKSNSAWFPDLPEQQAIARFLDDKTDKIDRAMKIKEGQIALLRERKQIIIQEAVTKGLNPDAPMKDSGIEWIGQVPAHWDILPLLTQAKIKSITNCADWELLSVYLDKGVIRFSDVDEKRTNATSLDLSNYQAVEPGNLVLNNQQAWRGSVGVSSHTGIVSPAYIVLKLSEAFDSDFANYYFRVSTTVAHYLVNSKGVGTIQRNLYWPKLKRAPITIPPIGEQKEIVRHIDLEVAKVEAAIELKQRQIEALKEYKATLINAAVTGKIKVI